MRPVVAVSHPFADADGLEATLRDLLAEAWNPPRTPRGPGAPAVIPALMLWIGLVVCLLRQQFNSQLELWRLLTEGRLWDFPRVRVTEMAVYQRLSRT